MDLLDELNSRNKTRILTSTTLDDKMRAQLIAAQMVIERIGNGPMEQGLRMVFEQALLCYLTGEFDRLHAMGLAGVGTETRRGTA